MSPPLGLGTLLRLLVARLDEDVQALYDERGLAFRPRFYPIVEKLAREGPTRVTELARATSISQPAATQTLAELKRLGLVTVSAGADRRERLARLTEEGERLARGLEPTWRAIARAADALEPALVPAITRALDALDRQGFAERIEAEMEE